MADITIDNSYLDALCFLPRAAANYLDQAGADELKTLIFVLTRQGPVSYDEIRELKMSVETFVGCVEFWKKNGVLQKIRVEYAPSLKEEIPDYPLEVVTAGLRRDNSLRSFLEMAEFLLGKTLTSNEVATLYGICDYLHMTPDTVILLIEHCVGLNKRSIAYIEKVAVAWAKEGVLTHDAAERHLKKMEEDRSYFSRLCRLFKIRDRELTPSEQKYAQGWQEMGISDEDLLRAYDKTVTNTGKIAFPYMDKILRSWQADEKKVPSQKLTGNRAPVRQNKSSGRLNYEELERQSLENMKRWAKEED